MRLLALLSIDEAYTGSRAPRKFFPLCSFLNRNHWLLPLEDGGFRTISLVAM